MKERFPILIDRVSINSIIEIKSKSSFGYILRNRAKVYLEMSQNEIDEMEHVQRNTYTDPIALFFSEIGITPYPGKSYFEKFSNLKGNSFIEFNGWIFILDIKKEDAKVLSQESGIWVISKDEIDSDAECLVLDSIRMDHEDVIPQNQYNDSEKNGWNQLLGDRKYSFPPFNEILVYDNFIKEFRIEYSKPPYKSKKIDGKKIWPTYIGLENLLLLLNIIIPQKHNSLLKVLIVFPKYTDPKYESRLEKRLQIWIDEVKKTRLYDLKISCLLIGNKNWPDEDKESHPVHPRVLYTNYFFIGTEKGFKIFEPYPYSETVRKDGDSNNSLSVSSYFSSPRMFSNPIKANYNNKLHDIGEQLMIVSDDIDSYNNNIIGEKVSIYDFYLFDEIDFN